MAAGMVRLSMSLSAASTRAADDLLEGLQYLLRRTRLETGCAGCNAWVDADGVVHYVEDWTEEADIRRRVLSHSFTSVLTVAEAAQQFDVQFQFVTATRGLDYVNEVRDEAQRAAGGREES
jgi:hypothetical protein